MAVKARRIATHPDKLIQKGKTDQEKSDINTAAQLVGQAADVLLNPIEVSAQEALFKHILMLYIA